MFRERYSLYQAQRWTFLKPMTSPCELDPHQNKALNGIQAITLWQRPDILTSWQCDGDSAFSYKRPLPGSENHLVSEENYIRPFILCCFVYLPIQQIFQNADSERTVLLGVGFTLVRKGPSGANILFFFFFAFSWAAPIACGGSQARGLIRAVATGLRHSHSHSNTASATYTTAHGNAGS